MNLVCLNHNMLVGARPRDPHEYIVIASCRQDRLEAKIARRLTIEPSGKVGPIGELSFGRDRSDGGYGNVSRSGRDYGLGYGAWGISAFACFAIRHGPS